MRKKYKLEPETKREAMPKRVPFFDLQYEMNNGLKFRGYVSEPRYANGTPMGYASSEDEPTDCAVLYSQWSRVRECNLDPKDIRCAVKCELCKLVGHTNDYMRGFTQSKGKRVEAKPHYPVPATLDNAECASNYLNLNLCRWASPCQACIDKFLDGIKCYL